MFKGRKGLRAPRLVESNFPKLDISRARIHGKAEVIDTYWAYRALLGDKAIRIATPIYSPRVNLDRGAALAVVTGGMAPGKKGVSEWRDGKLVPVRPRRRQKA